MSTQQIGTSAACTLLIKAVNGLKENSMSNTNYQAMSDQELVDYLEKGGMHNNPNFFFTITYEQS